MEVWSGVRGKSQQNILKDQHEVDVALEIDEIDEGGGKSSAKGQN